MGRVLTEATIENLEDLWAAKNGYLAPDEVRRVVVHEALVDTGATQLCLPKSMIAQLGLQKISVKQVINAAGFGQTQTYGTVRLTIESRICHVDVSELPDGVPVLIGQIPLECLDFLVDPKNHRLIGNPAHGGEHVIEIL